MGGQLRWEGDFQMGKSKTSGSPKRENTLAKKHSTSSRRRNEMGTNLSQGVTQSKYEFRTFLCYFEQ